MNPEPAKFPSKKRSLSFFKLLYLVLYTRETLEDHDFLFVLRPLSSRRDIQSSLRSSNRSSVTRCTPEASFVTEMETSRGQICVLLILSFAFATTALLRLLGGKMWKACYKWKYQGATIFECRAFFNLCNASCSYMRVVLNITYNLLPCLMTYVCSVQDCKI